MAKLYLVSQEFNTDWDTYDSMIVVADDEMHAKNVSIECTHEREWAELEHLEVEEVGEAKEGFEGCVIASFNAG